MAESGAYELEHRGTIHRASGFDVLIRWAEDLRVDEADRFRPAGSDEWTPVMEEPRLRALLSPENHWKVRMASGEFTAGSFEIVVRWAQEGRLSTDAVVEGPRTPPGGVQASALPVLARRLVEPRSGDDELPRLNIDGRIYPAPDVETVSRWISESRVPLDASISLAGGPWEPVASCGLFDLEKWPHAALEDTGEPGEEEGKTSPGPTSGPEAEARIRPETFRIVSAVEKTEPATAAGGAGSRGAVLSAGAKPEPAADGEAEGKKGQESSRVITGSGVEHSDKEPDELLSMIRKREIARRRSRRTGWRIAAVVVLLAVGAYLADTLGWISLPWLP